ncbi:RNase P subunit p30-domain-containing protein [Truncatella angustata]|uniref:RNase P subunit p30-domain-containing protein n=1 Tax=Truncatella angustata TaxID=152316 RepID=A0A9P8URK5_9PEZI|nr:RNase P subunit p30-domain-containing protein [Truncatella angustata]KAH6657700.1 RNase P subunit p30-domain-containing protein [Truncatella angustata]
MLYDLNIAWSPSTSPADLTRTLKFSASLGYDVVALSQTLSVPIPPQLKNPIPKFDGNHAQSPHDTLPTVLTRCTVPLADTSVGHHLPRLVNLYDIVAVRPTNEKGFQVACLNIDHAYLISLDLTSYLDFHFKPTMCMAAVKRGMRFEVCYSQVLGADARGRASFIGNLMQLARATRGRGIVISSEARNVMGLRGPADVTNLFAVWGLSTDKGAEALGVNPRGIVVNEGIKRNGFRGVIEIVQVADKPRNNGDKMEGVEQETCTERAENQGQKRKGGDTLGQNDASLSKRKAKKMKKLAMLDGKPAENKA